jgi:hypothetical protein
VFAFHGHVVFVEVLLFKLVSGCFILGSQGDVDNLCRLYMRQQLSRSREIESCRQCHQRRQCQQCRDFDHLNFN